MQVTYPAEKARRPGRTRTYVDPTDPEGTVLASVTNAVSSAKGSVSKRTPGGEVVPLDAHRCATWVTEHRGRFAGLSDADLFEAVAAAAPAALAADAARGSAVHAWLEDHLRWTPSAMAPAGAAWEQSAAAALEALDPEPWALEAVCVIPKLGLAGTADFLGTVTLGGRRRFVIADWKSRAAGGSPGPWESEVAQLGCYSLASHVLGMDDSGEAVRLELPKLQALAVVAIAPERFVIHEVAVGKARTAARLAVKVWQDRRRWERTSRAAVADSTPVGVEAGRALLRSAETSRWLRRCVSEFRSAGCLRALADSWPPGIARPAESDTWSEGEVVRVVHAVRAAAARAGIAVPAPPGA